ncbi:MAG: ABC transporter permease [Cyanobacteria bacterium P01_H01_bin.15]
MIVLANILAIFRKELQGYFASPLAYVLCAVFWLISGVFLTSILMGPNGIVQQVAFSEQRGIPVPALDVAAEFLRWFFGVMGTLVLFILPILSMGLYTEERKRGTLELLATSPISNWAVAVGKLLGVLTFFVTMLMPLMLWQAIAFSTANPPMSPTVPLLAHVGLILMAAAILSLGMFISSLTDSTILAAFLTFALILFLWVTDLIAGSLTGWAGAILTYLSLLEHYDNFLEGILDPASVVVFVSYIFLGIFLTAQSIEALRFQRS